MTIGVINADCYSNNSYSSTTVRTVSIYSGINCTFYRLIVVVTVLHSLMEQ